LQGRECFLDVGTVAREIDPNAGLMKANVDLSQVHLCTERYLLLRRTLALLTCVAPGDALCKPLSLELYEPVLTRIGNGPLVLRGF
jgi:hypothetical protein